MAQTDMSTSRVLFEGRTSVFHFSNEHDHIQSFHRRGSFYELRQLQAHRDIIPMHSTVLDIGANVGNHTLFYAMHTWAGFIYPFEPNSVARTLLLASLNANSDYRARVNTDYVKYAVGRERARLSVASNPENNLGGTTLYDPGKAGRADIDCVRLDDLSFQGPICFLKIDVEGMELDVLAGAEKLIDTFRPTIAIEVVSQQEAAFWAWVEAHRYQVVGVYFEYLHLKNYIAVPTGGTH